MAISREDLLFAKDVRSALESQSDRGTWWLLILILVGLGGALVWAHLAVLEEVTNGEGRVIPSRQIQVVQTLEGGILRRLLVKEGQSVETGQVIARIDDTRFSSELAELQQQYWANTAKVARLRAEALGQDIPTFTDALQKSATAAVTREAALFEARKRQLFEEEKVANHQLEQRRQQLNEFQESDKKLRQSLALIEREYELTRRLYVKRTVPELEFLRLKRTLVEKQGELKAIEAAGRRAEAAIAEAQSKIKSILSKFRADARGELTIASTELSVINEKIRAATDRVVRTELRSPVKGIVNKLNMTTVGAVIGPGQELMTIVPVDDTLLIEAQVQPKDVAFIRPGQPASVKLTAYDYTVYGDLKGQVERISADTIQDEQGNKFYRVVVRTSDSQLGSADNPLPIIPGMVATVDILTGEKTVLDYILKPIRKASAEALRER